MTAVTMTLVLTAVLVGALTLALAAGLSRGDTRRTPQRRALLRRHGLRRNLPGRQRRRHHRVDPRFRVTG